MKKYGFVRVASCVPELRVADVTFNVDEIIRNIKEADTEEVAVIVFPELSITGYTCSDLFFQEELLTSSKEGVRRILEETKDLDIISIIGAPVSIRNQLFNCGMVISKGHILGIVPKTYIPNYNEFYEKRWFATSLDLMDTEIKYLEEVVPIGTDLLFQDKENLQMSFGIEICEDLWSIVPPSNDLALNGANMIFNLSSSNELIGKYDYRKNLVKGQSAKLISGYIYTSSGISESTTDVVFSGHAMIAENGQILKESNRFQFAS